MSESISESGNQKFKGPDLSQEKGPVAWVARRFQRALGIEPVAKPITPPEAKVPPTVGK